MRRITRGGGAYILIALFSVPLALVGYEWLSPTDDDEEDDLEFSVVVIDNDEKIKIKDLHRRSGYELAGHPNPASLTNAMLNQFALALLQQMSAEYIMAKEAKKYGIRVPQKVVSRTIANHRYFQGPEGFSPDFYLSQLGRLGYSPDQHRDMVHRQTDMSQLVSGYYWGAFYLDTELEQLARWYELERDIQYFVIRDVDLVDQTDIEESEIESEYTDNGSNYLIEDSVDITYYEVRLEHFHRTVNEDRVQEALAVELEALQSAHDVYHIMAEVTENRNEQATLLELEALRQRHLEGDNFLALAQEHSEDHATREIGGYLGDRFDSDFPKEFRTALESMPIGSVSEPVRTELGWHIIYYPDPNDSIDTIALEEDVRARVQVARDNNVRNNYIATLKESILDVASIEALAELYPQDTLKSVKNITREGKSEGVFSNPNVLTTIFSEDSIDQGIFLIDVRSDYTLVVEIDEYVPPTQMTLDQARSDIEDALKLRKAQESLEEYVQTLVKELRPNARVNMRQAPSDYKWDTVSGLKRYDREHENGAVAAAAFSQPASLKDQPALVSGQINRSAWCIVLVNEERIVDITEEKIDELSKRFTQSTAIGYTQLYTQQMMLRHTLRYPQFEEAN